MVKLDGWMRTRCFRLRTVWLVLLILACAVAPAAAQETTENQFWPEVDAFIKLSPGSRLFLTYSATRLEDVGTYSDGQIGAFLDVYSFRLIGSQIRERVDIGRSRSFMLRVGYAVDRAPTSDDTTSVTHMPSVEAHMRVMLPGKLLLADRNRFDFRVVDGDYRPRYRNRIKVERTFKPSGVELNPYAHFEFFYNWTTDRINRYRFSGGMEWTVTKHVIVEGYYSRQVDTNATRTNINALGIVAQFHFQ